MEETGIRRKHIPRLWAIVLGGVLAILAGVLAVLWYLGGPDDRIPRGTSIAQIPVEGLTQAEAVTLLERNLLPRYAQAELHLYCGNTLTATLTGAEIGVQPDLKQAVEETLSGSPSRLSRGWRALLGRGEVSICPPVRIDRQQWEAAVPSTPQNARYDAASGQVVEGRPGIQADLTKLEEALTAAAGRDLSFPVQVQEPEISAEHLQAVLFRDQLGTCSTEVGGSQVRKKNVLLSAQAIDGVVLEGGGLFDYNSVVGERTLEKGYGAAPAYVNGESVNSVGGGICQTSSTLYLAALLSDLEIVERRAHRYQSSYIPLGMDATVSWGGPEFRFRNDTAYPIKIRATVAGDVLTVTIWGTKLDDSRVEMTSEVIDTAPYGTVYRETEELTAGETRVQRPGRTGYTVQTYRQIYDGEGNLLRSAPEARSVYRSQDRILLVGVKPSQETQTPLPIPETTDDPLPLRDRSQMEG